jgi:hypothetical protein
MPALEKHYTCLELSKLWKLGPDTVRALFRDTPGVLKISRPSGHRGTMAQHTRCIVWLRRGKQKATSVAHSD